MDAVPFDGRRSDTVAAPAVPAAEPTARGANEFEARFRRRYALTALAWGGILGLVGAFAAWTEYRSEELRHRTSVRQELLAAASVLAARTAVARQQVERLRADMADRLARPEPAAPELIDGMRRDSAAARAAHKPRGAYFSRTAGRDPAYLEATGGDSVLAGLGRDPEVNAALGLTRALQNEFRSSPVLLQAGYVSGSRFFSVMADRQPPTGESGRLAYIRTYMPGASLDEFYRGALDEIGPVRPRSDPDRGLVWIGPMMAQVRKAPKLLIEAPVYSGDQFVGAAVMTFAARELLRVPHPNAPSARFLLLTKSGLDELDRFTPVKFAGVAGPSAAAKFRSLIDSAAPGELVAAEGMRFAAVPVQGVRWLLVWSEPEAEANRWALRAGGLIAAALALLALVALLSFIRFRRDFLQPALQLIGSARGRSGEPIADKVNPLWRPLAEQLDRHRAETARHVASLEEQYELTSAILQCSIDAIVTTDETGAVIDFNPAAESAFGWRAEEVAGRSIDALIPPGPGGAGGLGRFRGGAQGRTVETQGRRRDGTPFPLELAVAETRVDERRIFIGYLRDLSERKAAEAELSRSREALHQSEKLAALGQLLAGVAHELNNPLAVVVGRSAILAEKLDATPHARPLQKLRTAADRCARIVRTFLAMARQTGPRRSAAQVNELVAAAVELTAYGLRTAGVEVVEDLAPAVPPIEADPDQIVQILINLIVNAQQALETVDGLRRLTLRTSVEAEARWVTIEVADTGPGVPAATAGRIFEPFFTTKSVGNGTGLGLSVCKGMAEGHGGTLELVATGGPGATFRVRLPLLPVEDSRAAGEVGTAGAPPRSGRVLIVDDEIEIAAVLADCLAPLGLAAEISGDAAHAMARIAESPFDAIFCDVRMPGTDGIAFYAALRRTRPDQAARFAFVSGDVLHRDIAALTAAEDRPVIEKPFDPRQVRAVALALIEGGALR